MLYYGFRQWPPLSFESPAAWIGICALAAVIGYFFIAKKKADVQNGRAAVQREAAP